MKYAHKNRKWGGKMALGQANETIFNFFNLVSSTVSQSRLLSGFSFISIDF